jgi:hypothetical protein
LASGGTATIDGTIESEFTDCIEEDRPGGNPTGHQILTDDREFM